MDPKVIFMLLHVLLHSSVPAGTAFVRVCVLIARRINRFATSVTIDACECFDLM
jgi:hypothetical protein